VATIQKFSFPWKGKKKKGRGGDKKPSTLDKQLPAISKRVHGTGNYPNNKLDREKGGKIQALDPVDRSAPVEPPAKKKKKSL